MFAQPFYLQKGCKWIMIRAMGSSNVKNDPPICAAADKKNCRDLSKTFYSSSLRFEAWKVAFKAPL